MGLAELRADAKLLRESYAKRSPENINYKDELADNVIPLLEGIIEAIQEGVEADVADLGAAVDELIDQDSDVLHPETAQKFAAVLEVGKLMATELERNIGKLDDVTKKKVKQLVKAYRQGAEVLAQIIMEITLPDGDDEDDEDEDGKGDSEPSPANDEIGDDPDDEDEIAADGGEG